MIDDTVTDGIFSSTGTEYSQETTPASSISEVVIENVNGGPEGRIILQEKTPNGDWINVSSRSNSYIVLTPDTNITYRFKANQHKGNSRVYFNSTP